mmetsp:Transcript_10903/g.23099  ORF Transcript_10903/g.23099 Transcript_10903/m.23099 type:complete len:82 (-) Transcript_10903:1331-1576(-)
MTCLAFVRPIIYARHPAYHGSASRAIRKNFATNNRRKNQNQWLHAKYDRKRHADVNRSTGGIFFVTTTVAAGVSVYIMGKS